VGAQTPTIIRNFSYPFKHYLTMLRAQPIYNTMSTLLHDYERLLAIIHHPENCEWHKPYIVNTIKAFVAKHESKPNDKVVYEMREHLLMQTNKH
jgi:hypothetical protein